MGGGQNPPQTKSPYYFWQGGPHVFDIVDKILHALFARVNKIPHSFFARVNKFPCTDFPTWTKSSFNEILSQFTN